MCGRVSVSKLCMDKLRCMFVCMYARACVRMYGCMDGWMDGCIYVCIYVFMYVCVVGPQARLFFPRAERWHGRDEDGKVPGYRKMRPLLPSMMLWNSSICAMKSVPGRTTENAGCHEDF